MKIKHRAVTSVSIIVFLAVLFVTKVAFQCEAIRKIPGKVFPWGWGILLVCTFCLAYVAMLGLIELMKKSIQYALNKRTLSHVDIPHLLRFPAPAYNNGYYLLQLRWLR